MKKSDDISKKNPFKVPDNYFEEVNRKILSATAGVDETVSETSGDDRVIKISLYHRFRTRILIAASIAGFIIISYTALKLFVPGSSGSQVSEVLYNMNQDSLINEIDISSLEEDASSLLLSDEGPDVSKNDIIDYLMLENIDLNDIYEQL
jgi:hypothetical protein